MNRKHLALLLLLFGLGHGSWAQQSRLDSLNRELAAHTAEDGQKAQLLILLSESYYLSDPATGLKYADRAIVLAGKLADRARESLAYRLKGLCYYMQSNYPEALINLQTSSKLAQQLKDPNGAASAQLNIANIYVVQGNYPRALASYQQALTTFEQVGNKFFASACYANMSVIYSEQQHYTKALDYLNKARINYEQLNQQTGVASCLATMGVISTKQKRFSQAITYFHEALAIHDEYGIKSGVALDNGNIGSTLARMGQYTESTPYLLKAVAAYSEMDNKKGLASNLQTLGYCHFKLGQETQAMDELRKSFQLAKQTGILDVQKDALQSLSELFEKQGQPDSALSYYKQAIVVRDSISNDERKQQITRLEMQYDFDIKESGYRQQQALSDAKMSQQQLSLALNEAQLARSRQAQKLQQLTNLEMKTQLRAEQLTRQNEEKLRIIAEQERNAQTVKIKSLAQESELIRLRSRQQQLYALLGIGSVMLALGYVLYWARMRQLRLRNMLQGQQAQQQASELLHRHQLSESELKAIRSQMNPHFIFNVLNSIDSYILESDPQTASKLIQKFAALSRLILENSTQSLVTVEREWKALQLYAELEAIRYDYQFQYAFNHETAVPLNQLLMPPMLVQPLLENAILHGLRPYKGADGLLSVELVQQSDLMVFTVSDNGIGLNASAKHAAGAFNVKQQSLALKAIQERVSIINRNSNRETASFQLRDRTAEGARGTAAELRLPLNFQSETDWKDH